MFKTSHLWRVDYFFLGYASTAKRQTWSSVKISRSKNQACSNRVAIFHVLFILATRQTVPSGSFSAHRLLRHFSGAHGRTDDFEVFDIVLRSCLFRIRGVDQLEATEPEFAAPRRKPQPRAHE